MKSMRQTCTIRKVLKDESEFKKKQGGDTSKVMQGV